MESWPPSLVLPHTAVYSPTDNGTSPRDPRARYVVGSMETVQRSGGRVYFIYIREAKLFTTKSSRDVGWCLEVLGSIGLDVHQCSL